MKTPAPPRSRRRAVWVLFQAAVIIIALGYIAWGLYRGWGQLRQHSWMLRPGLALLSLAAAIGWFLCRAWLWQRILISLGFPLPYRRVYRAWILSELARFLPGKIWYAVSRTYYAERDGVPPPVALTGMAVELAVVTLAALAFFPLRAEAAAPLLRGPIFAAVIAVAVAVLIQPRPLLRLVSVLVRRIPSVRGGSAPALAPESLDAAFGWRTRLEMLALSAAMWVCLAGGFLLLACSMSRLSWSDALAVSSSFPVAWVVAMAAVISPAGLGVRESVLAALLAEALPGGVGVVVALASRLWVTLAELLCAAAAWRR